MSKKRDIGSVFLVFGIVAAVCAAAFLVIYPHIQPTETLRMGDGVFRAKVTTTDSAWQSELGSTKLLGVSEAKLMTYSTAQILPIDSSKLGAPTDIIWVNDKKIVVHIVKNIQPSQAIGSVYTPAEKASYVVLLAAGTADSRSIRTGKTVVFEGDSI